MKMVRDANAEMCEDVQRGIYFGQLTQQRK